MAGVEVVGSTNHTNFKSIYFFDSTGRRLELAVNIGTSQIYRKSDTVKRGVLDEWAKTKRAPTHAAWLHDGSMVLA